MASQCPKCHETVDEDVVCCAGVEFQWLCQQCHKRTRGFIFPFGRCPLCGGELKRVEGKKGLSGSSQLILQEALQIEVTSHLFYRRLAAAVEDPEVGDFLESMATMERDHALELSQKYHLHLGEEMFRDDGKPLPYPFFEDLCFFADTGDLHRLYDCAIRLETKTLDFFREKASLLPAGFQQRLYRELAAEETEHIALLEAEKGKVGEL